MRGILAAVAAVAVSALSATPAPEAALAANVRTITGYTAGGKLHWEMSEIFQGGYCSASSGNTCTPIDYLSGVPLVGEFSGLTMLTVALWTAPAPTTVLGFSQGSLIATEWLRVNDGKWNAPSPEDLSFILVANPLRKYGGVRPVYDIDDPTPDTSYDVLDIAIEYDGVADLPDNLFNLLAFANALAGSTYVHIDGYDDVDLETAEKLVWKEGNTTYVLIRNKNIPLLEPLREMGLGAVADFLNGPLKTIIDSGYDRNYAGLIDPDEHAAALEQFASFDATTAPTAARNVPNRSAAETESPENVSPQQESTLESTLESPQQGSPDPSGANPPDQKDPEISTTSEAGDAAAEDPGATSEPDEQADGADIDSARTETDEVAEEDMVAVPSDPVGAEDGIAADAESLGSDADAASETGSGSEATESPRGGESGGPDSGSAAPSGGSGSTSGSSTE